ncbi:MAG: heme-binding domain-containing protein [Bacteroidia bacterium]
MKLLLKIILVIVLIFGIMQLFRIDKTNPETVIENQFSIVEDAPEDVLNIMKNACYDCHSNQTKYPWYSNVAPISWVVKDHIDEGREEMNFSEWGSYSDGKRHHKLEECLEEVAEGEMPLKGYVVWHSEALLTPQDTAVLFSFWRKTMKRYPESH